MTPTESIFKGKTVFISYRRDDTGELAKRLHYRLKIEVPELKVVRDETTLAAGREFSRELKRLLRGSDVVLALIGSEWLTHRIHDREDVLRREIATAIREGKDIIPVLVDGAEMPDAEDLPKDLRETPGRHALKVFMESLSHDVVRLRIALERLFNDQEIERQSLPELDDLTDQQVQEALIDLPRYVPVEAAENTGIPSRRFPTHGRWECTISYQGRKSVLTVDIEDRPRSPFHGTLVSQAPGTLSHQETEERVKGSWATYLDIAKHRVLGFYLKGVKDSGEPFEWSIPIHETMGDGYFGRGADGATYYSNNVDPTDDKL